MIITAFFSICMAIVIYLFVLSGNLFSLSAWMYAVFLFVLFVGMVKTRKFSRFRRIFLVSFALFFTISFVGNLRDVYGSIIVGEGAVLAGDIPFNQFLIPVLPVFIAFARTVQFPAPMAGGLLSVFGLTLVWLMAAITIGKGWCGWVCPFGGFEEGFSRVLKKPILSVSPYAKRLRIFHLVFFVVILIISAIILSPVYIYYLNPFNLVTGFFSAGDICGTIAIAVSIFLFVSLVIVLPLLTRKRFQCSTYCPLGALHSLVHGLSLFKVIIDANSCDRCMKCVASCQFSAIDEQSILSQKPAVSMACANCGECVDLCPNNAIRFEYSFMTNTQDKPEAKSARGKVVQGILDPALIFGFSAFTFSVFVSSFFAVDALNRIISFVGVYV